MKKLLTIILLGTYSTAFAQLEISTGYAVNRLQADGVPIHFGYDYKLMNKLYTKSQIGYKYLYHYNDFVEATVKISIIELHQTFSYEMAIGKKIIFKPNLGFNYRFYSVLAEIKPPYNTLPQRAWIIARVRGDRIRLNSFDGDGLKIDKRKIDNAGFSLQLQSQFKIDKKVWFHITPFYEPDYDGSQATGGCYIGIILKQIK
jgi:hypothetical protein